MDGNGNALARHRLLVPLSGFSVNLERAVQLCWLMRSSISARQAPPACSRVWKGQIGCRPRSRFRWPSPRSPVMGGTSSPRVAYWNLAGFQESITFPVNQMLWHGHDLHVAGGFTFMGGQESD